MMYICSFVCYSEFLFKILSCLVTKFLKIVSVSNDMVLHVELTMSAFFIFTNLLLVFQKSYGNK